MVHGKLMYTPQLRPRLIARQILEDELVMVAPWSDGSYPEPERYVLVDWGPEFVQAHALELPELTETGLSMSLGAMVADYMMTRGKAGYLPARFAKRFLDQGRLHLVSEARSFPYPVWLVWRSDMEPTVRDAAFALLEGVAKDLAEDQVTVLQQLDDFNDQDGPDLVLGAGNGPTVPGGSSD